MTARLRSDSSGRRVDSGRWHRPHLWFPRGRIQPQNVASVNSLNSNRVSSITRRIIAQLWQQWTRRPHNSGSASNLHPREGHKILEFPRQCHRQTATFYVILNGFLRTFPYMTTKITSRKSHERDSIGVWTRDSKTSDQNLTIAAYEFDTREQSRRILIFINKVKQKK